MKILNLRDPIEYEILIVDDNVENLKVLTKILKTKEYKVRSATNGKMALNSLRKKNADLLLLDINMPYMDGFEVIKIMKNEDELAKIPVIFLTAVSRIEDKLKAFEYGAVDFITKPFLVEEVLARVKTHLNISEMSKLLKSKNEILQEKVEQKARELTQAYNSTAFAMVELAEARDDDTGKHIQRISMFCEKISRLASNGKYKNEIDENFIKKIAIASPLHDIGKIGIRDNILLKPAKLTNEEFEIMKTHVLIGAIKIETIAKTAPKNSYIEMGAKIARYHHERWNGEGYMENLKGEQIPLEARIMSIADVYDALRSKRVYKEAYSHKKTIEIMKTMSGTFFDPYLFEVFFENNKWFEKVYEELSGVENEK